MWFRMGLAGLDIGVTCNFRQVRDYCNDYVIESDFSSPSIHDPDFVVDVSSGIYRVMAKNAETFSEAEEGHRYNFYNPAKLEVLETYRLIAEQLPYFDALLVHGSAIATDGRGYMFTAPSGTGKSTRTKLWLEGVPNSYVVNGDKPILRLRDDCVWVCGAPWCGKERWNTNARVPLQAIYLLERAEVGEEDTLNKVEQSVALDYMLRQTYIPDNHTALVLSIELLKKVIDRVAVYKFRCGNNQESVRHAWDATSSS